MEQAKAYMAEQADFCKNRRADGSYPSVRYLLSPKFSLSNN